ncbi:MAG: DMT family transporter [Candidatus Bruticola sp.]
MLEHEFNRNSSAANSLVKGSFWNQRTADLVMICIAMAWGTSYLFMKLGLEVMPPLSVLAVRFWIAFAVVSAIFFKHLQCSWTIIGGGALLGLFTYAMCALLILGLKTTTASNAGFLTSTAVVMVPILHALLTKRWPNISVIAGTVCTAAGIGLLTLQKSLVFYEGDILCFLGAIVYAFYIILTDKLSKGNDGLQLGIWQLGFAALYSSVSAMLFEIPSLPSNVLGWTAVLGLSLIGSAFAFVAQPIAQKYTTPEHTGVLFSLEPVFAALFAFIFLHETISGRGCLGVVFVLIGIVIVSLTSKGAQEKIC